MIRSLNTTIAALIAVAIVAFSCADHPASPSALPDTIDAGPPSAQASSVHQCLGYYLLAIDTENESVDVLPMRSGQWHFNLVGMLNSTMGVSAAMVPGESDPPNGLFVLDITLTHPFPMKQKFSGFDVKGVLITPGTLDISPLILADVDETRLENADGYTRWWNPTEFTTPGVLGYTQGVLTGSSATLLTATVNPYKLFADILGPEDPLSMVSDEPLDSDMGRAVFRAGSANTRRYRISFEMDPGPKVIFGYAIDCAWDFPDPNPPGEIPDDFPIEANQPEAFRVVLAPTANSLYYDSETATGGGMLRLQVNVHDWQGQAAANIADEVSVVRIFAPELMAGGVTADFLDETSVKARYTADLWGTAVPSRAGETLVVCRVGSADGSAYRQGAPPAPETPISAWQVITVDIPDPVCAADDNEDFQDAVPLDFGGLAVDQVCTPDDLHDLYSFQFDLGFAVTGEIRLYCDGAPTALRLYDEDESLVAETMIATDNILILDLDELQLMPMTYYIEVAVIVTDGMRPYMIENDGQLVDVTPNPLEVTPPGLYCNADFVWVEDDYAYMLGDGVWVYDISDPANPAQVAENRDARVHYAADFHYPYCYFKQYAGIGQWEINLVDFTDPSSPVLHEGVLQYTDKPADLVMNSTHLYTGNKLSPLSDIFIYDWASDPTSLSQVGTFQVPYEPHVLDLLDPEGPDTYLVVATWSDVLTYSVENPSSVSPKGDYSWPAGAARDIVTSGDYIYVAHDLSGGGDGWLYVLRQTTDPDVVQVGTVDIPGAASRIDFDSSYAYLGDGIAGLTICNVANPASPQHTSTTELVSYGTDVAFNDGAAYVVAKDAGLQAFDVTDPANPSELSWIKVINNPGMIVEKDGYLIIGDSTMLYYGIKILDISNPANAFVAGYYHADWQLSRLALEGDVLALSGLDHWGLCDVSDPLNIVEAGSGTTSNNISATGLRGDVLYISHNVPGSPELLIYDISNINSPVPQAPLALSQLPYQILFKDNYMYLICYAEVTVYDLTDPLAPVYAGNYVGPGISRGDIRGDYLHLTRDTALEITSLADPTTPAYMGSVDIPTMDPLDKLLVNGQFAYVGSMSLPTYACYVWPPDSPSNFGPLYPSDDISAGITLVYDGYLYESTEMVGLRIFDLY